MSDLGLTEEEHDYVEHVARDRSSAVSVLGFYACVFVPAVALSVHGLLERDVVEVFIAFAGLALFLAWRIGQEFRRFQSFKSLFRKIAQHERESGGA